MELSASRERRRKGGNQAGTGGFRPAEGAPGCITAPHGVSFRRYWKGGLQDLGHGKNISFGAERLGFKPYHLSIFLLTIQGSYIYFKGLL